MSVVWHTPIKADDLPKWNLQGETAENKDTLVYRLEYSGLLTAFVWTELADVLFTSGQQSEKFDGQDVCQLEMKLSTENYSMPESIYPLRYQWRSKVNPGLSSVYLVEEIASGGRDNYNVSWLNWKDKIKFLFRKRKKVSVSSEVDNYYDDDEFSDFESTETINLWEKDGAKPVPDFLNQLPLQDEKFTYLIYEHEVELEPSKLITDPLGVVFAARWHSEEENVVSTYDVTYKDDIRPYRIETLGKEVIEIGETKIPSIKIYVKRNNEEEAEEEGFVMIWITDDEKRIPLRYEVEVVLGSIRVQVTGASLQNYIRPITCINPALVAKH